MSKIYDSWERLVGATLKRELFRQLALADSRESSFRSTASDVSFDSSLDQDVAGSSRRSEIFEETEGLGEGNRTDDTFTLKELRSATGNFDPKNLIGEGGNWRLYKGHIRRINMFVAVKQFQENREFLVEVLMLRLLPHPNIVTLLGHCADGDQRLTVHEYMSNGSLEDHLFGPDKDPLDWSTRLKIAAGAARALEFLHERANPPVIHRNFKTSNILLDANFNAKLSNFGFAKLGPAEGKTHVSTRVMGTYGYFAPEYAISGKLTLKCDVYSFGVVLMEIITGRKAIDSTRPSGKQNLIAWARPLFKDRRKFPLMVDPLLQGNFPMRALYQVLAVAAMCLQEQDTNRPPMRDVVTALDYLSQQSSSNNGE